MKHSRFIFFSALAILALGAQGADIYVATTGNDTTGDGSASAPYKTIGAALEHAAVGGGDTILVGPGLYQITAQLEVTNATTVIGTAGREATEVRRAEVLATNKKPAADLVSRCLYLSHPQAKVEGITFSRGYLYCDAAGDATDRLLCRGSGVYIASGSLLSCAVTNCYIGRSKVGGALALQGANAFVSNCLVRANRSYGNSWENWGTGVIASGGQIVDSQICDNAYVGSSYPRGTGLHIEKPPSGATPVKVRRCQITGNYDNAASYVSYWGTAAGVQVMAPDALLENCLIAGNSTHGNGGGAYVNGARTTFVNCTIADNTAAYGGGVWNQVSTAKYRNCIIQGNAAPSDAATGAPDWHGTANFSYSLCPVALPTANARPGATSWPEDRPDTTPAPRTTTHGSRTRLTSTATRASGAKPSTWAALNTHPAASTSPFPLPPGKLFSGAMSSFRPSWSMPPASATVWPGTSMARPPPPLRETPSPTLLTRPGHIPCPWSSRTTAGTPMMAARQRFSLFHPF